MIHKNESTIIKHERACAEITKNCTSKQSFLYKPHTKMSTNFECM